MINSYSYLNFFRSKTAGTFSFIFIFHFLYTADVDRWLKIKSYDKQDCPIHVYMGKIEINGIFFS